MNRRHFIATPLGLLTGSVMADLPKVDTLDDVLRWLDRLERATAVRSTSAWKMQAVMEHLAQSIEMSIDGFPEPKPAWFQATLGPMAFGYFRLRGSMSHGLTEPIPGAPPLNQVDDWKPGAQRLRSAVVRFQTHTGPLKPHFAYGTLTRQDFARAHVFHVANHQDEILVN